MQHGHGMQGGSAAGSMLGSPELPFGGALTHMDPHHTCITCQF